MNYAEGQPRGMDREQLLESFKESHWGVSKPVREITAKGDYNTYAGTVHVETPQDLIDRSIFVHPKVVEATWGIEAVPGYTQAMAERVRTSNEQRMQDMQANPAPVTENPVFVAPQPGNNPGGAK